MTLPSATKINAFSAVDEIIDPSKHVNYLLGMVLGVKDFTQEFTYLANRDAWLARDTLGYGTLCGLGVSFDDKKNELTVAPGVALSPSGKFIQVDVPQCAQLDKWFAEKEVQDALKKVEGGSATLYLKLCYRSCLTDPVQIAGEPCRTDTGDDSSLLKPSRIQDDFHLDLSLDPVKLPDQTEEDALRDFVAWLRQIQVDTNGSSPEDFVKAIRDAAIKPETYPATDFMKDPPPAKLLIPSAEVDEYLRLAFRIWTVELRGNWRGKDADCVRPSQEDCVLLAELAVTLDGDASSGWTIDSLAIGEERRPYLLHLRMVQEWMLHKTAFPGNTVVEEKGWGQPHNPGASELYSRADHTHGTPPDPIPPHKADPKAHTLDGEVTGFISDTRVAEIIGVPVAKKLLDKPHAGQVLTFTGEKIHWQAMDLPDLQGEVTGPLAETHVARILDLPVADKADDPQAEKVLMLKKLEGAEGGLEWQTMSLPDLSPPPVVLNGDVVNPPGDNRIDKLQGNLVDAPKPQPGDVLTFVQGNPDAPNETERQNRWVPGKPTGGATGQFVTRALEADYGIVAAGVCYFKLDMSDNASAASELQSSYNGLAVVGAALAEGNFMAELVFSFNEYEVPEAFKTNYIVKLTAWMESTEEDFFIFPFAPYLIGFKENGFRVGLASFVPLNSKRLGGKLMIEVSRFEPDGPLRPRPVAPVLRPGRPQ